MGRRIRSLKIGTRGSSLALRQTEIVANRLKNVLPDLNIKVIPIKTKGDRIKTVAELRKAGKGLFVKEIENALLSKKIDMAVHSLKDMPSEQPEGLVIGAILQRDEVADAFVSAEGTPFETLPRGTVVGTSSLRRQAQVRHYFPNVEVVEIKGNLDTRIAALLNKRTKLEGIIVAAAGMHRLYPSNGLGVHTELISTDMLVPCPGQGTICIETRENHEAVLDLIGKIHHEETAACVTAERTLMKLLEGGCQVPLGAHAVPDLSGFEPLLHLKAFVGTPDGAKQVIDEVRGSMESPVALATGLANMLRARGATNILASLAPRRNGSSARNGRKPAHRRKAKPKAKSRGRRR